jgi:hypothetical protein
MKTKIKTISLLTGTLLVAEMLFAAGSPVGDVVGKLTVGYQGWFACSNDLSPRNKWVHWITNSASAPSPTNCHFDVYPDIREYSTTYSTGFGNLKNGSPAKLFSSYDNSTVDTHVRWMQTYGIDTIALQRFGCSLSDTNVKAQLNGIATKVKNAAQTFGRKFYIMYDISDWTNFQTEMKTDWTNTIVGTLALTNSSAYAKQNGKPVVCVWGIGCDGRPGNNTSWNDVVNFFKGKNCYVIIGTKRAWATNTISVYTNANMITPWTVGSFTNEAGADSYATLMGTDQSLLNGRGQDFLPVVWPGFSWAHWQRDNPGPLNKIPRYHGNFMWRQFYNVRNKNVPSVYVAMFDEYDEGTAIAKAAENVSMTPTNLTFVTMDIDGTECTSDFYLRLAGDGGSMVKSNAAKVTTHPTLHTIVTNRSFEVNTASWTLTGSAARSTTTAAEGGVASMKLSAASSYATQTVPIESGKTYYIQVCVNVTARTAGMVVFDTSDKYDGTGQGQVTYSATTGGWQKYTGSFTATNTSITLRCFSDAAFAGTAYFDQIDVRIK